MAGPCAMQVSSFVFLDLEATGLAGIGEKPRITELSLVAVHRTSLLEKTFRNTPRVLNKLTLCLNPQKAIGHEASSITGLYNDALSLQCPFSESVVDICNLFFEQLPLPICLLAHNGNKYDFPLLAAELHRIGRHFPEDILCSDTLDAFRDVLSLNEVQEKILKPSMKYNTHVPSPSFNVPLRYSNPKHVRRLNMDGASNPEHPPYVTPEMAVVKSHINYNNAPKKKPQPPEPPKAVRISSAKRKLEFGSSNSALNEVDDVDREDVMDSIHGFHLTPKNATITVKRDKNEIIQTGNGAHRPGSSASQGFESDETSNRQWQELTNGDEVADDVLVEAVAQFEHNQGFKSKSGHTAATANPPEEKADQQEATGSRTETVTDQKDTEPHTCGSQQSLQDDVLVAVPLQPVAGQSEPSLNCPATTSSIPTTPNTANGDTNHLDSFPTPSPSPHKDLDERVLSSNLSPLAVPFVPQGIRANPKQSHVIASTSGRHSPVSSNPLGISLALSSLHRRIMGYEPEDSHRAEDDCMSLLRLCNKLSPWLIDWIDAHSANFSSVPPLYKAAKRPRKP